ncbi:MAG: non-homologous end-joining DNA ligase [Actinomycetota bacterium]|nr:non-homologous end-joining DNA ligase [Actinomycetota bacterium]
MTDRSVEVDIGGRQLKLTNLDKVLWPEAGFTKGQMIDYYARVAGAMLPHLKGRPITLRRFPNGVDAKSFFEKNCPSHRPPWLPTITMADISYCGIDEPAALVWTANLAAIELHPTLAVAEDLERPTMVVFDLDPGEGADVLTCGQVAFWLRDALDALKLKAWVKTSGSKGLQVYVPLNTQVTYDHTRTFSHVLAQVLERQHPDLIVTTQDRSVRPRKVLIDWSQNTASKTTVAVYALRARPRPTASTPVEWDEVEAACRRGDAGALVFEAGAVLERVEARGDLMAPVLTLEQSLPQL